MKPVFNLLDKYQMMHNYVRRGRGPAGGLVAAIEDIVTLAKALSMAADVINRNQFLLLDDPASGKFLEFYDQIRGVKPE